MSAAILFDRDRVDRLASLSDLPDHLGDSKLLWVDLQHDGSEIGADEAAAAFALDDGTRQCLAAPPRRPSSTITAATSTSPRTRRVTRRRASFTRSNASSV